VADFEANEMNESEDGDMIPVVVMRGGTSKGVFIREHHLPPPGAARDAVLLDLMGTPDPMQIDGLGGSHVNTSKCMIIGCGDAPGIDVEYTAVQVGTGVPIVDYSGNCGNLSAAVGAYAIDEGLVPAAEPTTVVRMLNHNSHAQVVAHVPVRNGRAVFEGDYKVDGVPGTGAPITLEFLDPAGSIFGRLFPTGNRSDRVATPHGTYEVSVVDVSHPTVFVRAADLGLLGNESADQLNGEADLLTVLEEIRGSCAVLLNVVDTAREAAARSAVVPRLAIVAPPMPGSDTVNITGRTVAMGRVIHSYALTVAICTAAACRIAGTVPHAVAVPGSGDAVRIAHPSGSISASIKLDHATDPPKVVSASIVRTARRLLKGSAFLKHPAAASASKIEAVRSVGQA
jgi:2-methylaconitate cis-trans-isomerase PrpF